MTETGGWSALSLHDFLTHRNVRLLPADVEKTWDITQDYSAAFAEVTAELSQVFTTGGSGQEKVVFIDPDISFVVKLAGDPEYQNVSDGMNSLFQEYIASRDGVNSHDVMARTELFWHENGFPILVQEKLTNLTLKVDSVLSEEVPWLPEQFHFYAQIGQTSEGEWRIYDLDAGTLSDFYSEKEAQETINRKVASFFLNPAA